MQIQPDELQQYPIKSLRRSHPNPSRANVSREKLRTSQAEWRPVQHLLRPPAEFLLALIEGLVWIAGATALRLLAESVLVAMPQLWVPVALVLVAPAAIAIGLSTWAPPLSLLLGYRLLLTAFGLVLGGRL